MVSRHPRGGLRTSECIDIFTYWREQLLWTKWWLFLLKKLEEQQKLQIIVIAVWKILFLGITYITCSADPCNVFIYLFWSPWKHQKIFGFWCFQGDQKEILGRKGLKIWLCRWYTMQNENNTVFSRSSFCKISLVKTELWNSYKNRSTLGILYFSLLLQIKSFVLAGQQCNKTSP